MQHDAKERQRMMRAARRKLGLSQADVAAVGLLADVEFGGDVGLGESELPSRGTHHSLAFFGVVLHTSALSGVNLGIVQQPWGQICGELQACNTRVRCCILRIRMRSRRKSTERFYTPADVAAIFGIRTETVYRKVKSGEIPSMRLGKEIYIPRADIDALAGKEPDSDPLAAAIAVLEAYRS